MYLLMLIILVIIFFVSPFPCGPFGGRPGLISSSRLCWHGLTSTEKQLLNTYNTSFAIALLFIPSICSQVVHSHARTGQPMQALVLFFLVIAFLR